MICRKEGLEFSGRNLTSLSRSICLVDHHQLHNHVIKLMELSELKVAKNNGLVYCVKKINRASRQCKQKKGYNNQRMVAAVMYVSGSLAVVNLVKPSVMWNHLGPKGTWKKQINRFKLENNCTFVVSIRRSRISGTSFNITSANLSQHIDFPSPRLGKIMNEFIAYLFW